jgi:hypothetical protein
LADAGYSVRRISHPGGRHSWWVFTPEGELHRPSVNLLKRYATSTQQTYAYNLVDHLTWAAIHRKAPRAITIEDLLRYMNGLTGSDGVYGAAYWRPGRSPLSPSTACNVATVLKAYYLSLPACEGVSEGLIEALSATNAASRNHRGQKSFQGNPLAPRKGSRRPRFVANELVEALFSPGVLTTARDLMIVTWLHDGGLRVGGLCGLSLDPPTDLVLGGCRNEESAL